MSRDRFIDKRGVQLAIGAALIVIALVNTVRLETYINETRPRDNAQEQCQDKTTTTLALWAKARKEVEQVRDVRDALLIPFFAEIRSGKLPSPEVTAAVEQANLEVDRMGREREEVWEKNPLPTCDLGPR